MRQGRSSIKHEIKEMEIDKLSCSGGSNSKLKEEAHLSGAYIRSLVKQLTSSKTKDSNMTNPKDPEKCLFVADGVSGGGAGDSGSFPIQNLTTLGEDSSETSKTQQQNQSPLPPPQPQQKQQHKKQVRRRLHTSRPYQERLLNMAEARREIVTALKFHRAAMKQATEQQQSQSQNQDQTPQPQQPQPQPQPQTLHLDQQDSMKIKSRRNHRIYPSSSSSSTSSSNTSNITTTQTNPQPNFTPYTNTQFMWPHTNPTTPNLPLCGSVDPQSLANFPLPNQALGLNLNFQDFNNLDLTTPYQYQSNSIYSSSSTSSPSISAAISGHTVASEIKSIAGGVGLHAAMDDEEIAEIKSIGEKHQMEWSDTMSLVTSAYWLKFLRPEDQDQTHHDHVDHDRYYPFDDHYHNQLMEFPSWLSGSNDNHHFDDCYSSDDHFNSPSLSCMDIGEIEGVDGDWLA